MNKAAKTIGATVGSATLLGAAMMAAAPMPFVSNEDYGLEEASLETTSAVTESIKEVRGAFAFDQTTTVATASIVEVFNKAAATLCSAMPQYAMDAQGRPVCVKSPNTSFTATVDELSDEEGAQSYIIGCACATNAPGGGAIVNADVQGVPFASIVARAGIYTQMIKDRTPLDTVDFELIKEKPQLMAFSRARRKEMLGGESA